MLVRLGLLLLWGLRLLLLLLLHAGRLLLPHVRLLLLPHGRLLLLPHWGGCCPGDGSCERWLGLGLGLPWGLLELRLLQLEMNSVNPINPPAAGTTYLVLAILPRAMHHSH